MHSDGFTKLFSSILTSSIWSEDDRTRILWITILAITDQDGFCAASVPGLAAMARLSLPDTVGSLEKLESPDPYSRTRGSEGRRLQRIEGGWLVINHALYRDRERVEKRREYMKEVMRGRRVNGLLTGDNKMLTGVNDMLTGANASASASASLSSSDRGILKGARKGRPPRSRNPLMDALSEADGGPDGITPGAWGRIAKGLQEIRTASPDVTPEEIRRRIANYRTHMPGCACTSTALANHWAKCAVANTTAPTPTSTLPNTWHDPSNPRRNAF